MSLKGAASTDAPMEKKTTMDSMIMRFNMVPSSLVCGVLAWLIVTEMHQTVKYSIASSELISHFDLKDETN
jgi:hypothetical protein